jgi:hypothetical protein
MRIYLIITGLLLVLFFSCKKDAPKTSEKKSDTVVVKEYFSTGKVKTEISAIGELRQGWTRNYDIEGRLLSEVYYINNIREGTARNYYAASGKLNSTLEYKNGIKQGNETWYYESGKPYRVSPFVNGFIEGTQKLYYEDGKLFAEVPYKNGYPGTGLKEYRKDGTLVQDYPKLEILREDHLKNANKVILYIRLSDGSEDVKFFKGSLNEGKYLNKDLLSLATQHGSTRIDYNIRPGTAINQKTTIIAQYKTRFGNPLILIKNYSLQVVNK